MTDRRQALAMGLALAATPLRRVQAAEQKFRLAILRPGSGGMADIGARSLRAALGELGYVENQNLSISTRYAAGQLDRLPALAGELLREGPDVLLAVGGGSVKAVRALTTKLPIVMFGNFDPVAMGLVASLARPQGNVTGVLITPDGTLAGKKLELLKLAVPKASRFALLALDDPDFALQIAEARKAAEALDISLQVVLARQRDYDAAFGSIVAERTQALMVGAHSVFVSDRKPLIELAIKHRLPTVWEWPEQAEDGGLLAYGADLQALYRRIAAYLDRIVRGAVAGEMPVEQPSNFKFVINQQTARAIGLALPQSLLLRADRVIE
jgi:putative ABC transport system substrate-binding protein